MTKDELIVEQALEIGFLKSKLAGVLKYAKLIHNGLYAIGAPLNDNCGGFSEGQLDYLDAAVADNLVGIFESLNGYHIDEV